MVYHSLFNTNPVVFSMRALQKASMLGLSLLSLDLTNLGPAMALVKMETKTIDAALVYGMRNQKQGLSGILGNNWLEGENGALLNVYSPFMMLATKAAKAGFSSNPTKSELDQARKRFGKEVAFYGDPKNRLQVKFAVSLYGNSPEFAKNYTAKIVGFGRGKAFEIKPHRQNLDQVADAVSGGQANYAYEAVNGYYFLMNDLQDLEEFSLELTNPNAPPITFRLNNQRLY